MPIADYSAAAAGIQVTLSGIGTPILIVEHSGGTDTLTSADGLLGSAYDDLLVVGALDGAAADGMVLVDLGGGVDAIEFASTETVRIDGAGGRIAIGGGGFGFANVETIAGGPGSLFVYGGSAAAHYAGGAAVNYVEGSGAGTILTSTGGDSWFVARGGATIVSGAGDDLIHAEGVAPVTIVFARGSGHDMLGSHLSGPVVAPADPGGLPWLEMREMLRDRLGDTILLDGLTASDIELVWEWEAYQAPLYALGFNDPVDMRIGPAAIRILDTGETLHLGTLAGAWIGGDFCIVLIGSSDYDLVLDFRDGEGQGFEAFSADYDLFSFGGSSRYGLLDLFSPETLVSTPLDADWSAAASLIGRLGSEAGAVAGTNESDWLAGTAGSDDIFGGSGDDYIEDGGGDDFVRGGYGWDYFAAGAGDDDIDGGEGSDFLSFEAASAPVTIDLEAGTAASAEFGTDRLASIEDVAGGAGDDSLSGSAGADRLIGGSGDDLLFGRGGDDSYYYNRSWVAGVGLVGDAGDDMIEDSGGQDRLELPGIDVDDVSVSLAPDDSYVLSFGGGGVTIVGGALPANAIEEVWFAGGHRWTGEILTAMANPVVASIGTSGADSLAGTSGRRNHLEGLDGDDSLEGRAAPDRLEGGDGDDALHGGGGRDTLDGGDGADSLAGGEGRDLLTGGAGADLFRVGHADGRGADADRIADFAPGIDLIDLSQMDADFAQAGRQAFTFIGSAAFSATPGEVRVEIRDGQTWVLIDGYGGGWASIEIAMTGTIAITAADFIL